MTWWTMREGDWWTMREEGDMADHEGLVREKGDMVDHEEGGE